MVAPTDLAPHLDPAERDALCSAVRGLLGQHWPSGGSAAVPAAGRPVRRAYTELAAHGVTTLCGTGEPGGVLDLVAVMAELGRVTCPAPVLAMCVLNLAARRVSDLDPAAAWVLDSCRTGSDLPTLSFARWDGSASTPLALVGGRLTGTLDVLDLAGDATWIAVMLDDGIALIPAGTPGVLATDLLMFDREGQGAVTFDGAEVAATIRLAEPDIEALLAAARLGAAGRAQGSAGRAVEIAVEYAHVRKQFGTAIGAFQAVAHKLANCRIWLDAVSLSIRNAAREYDAATPAWPMLVGAAGLLASDYLRRVALEVHHTFGAIGYSEEHEAPRHFRQIHLDLLRYGGTEGSRDVVAGRFLDGDAPGFPEYELGADAESFRREVRSWLAEHWSAERKREHDALSFYERRFHPEFAREMGGTGWNGLTWPSELGGMDRGIYEQLVLLEEFGRVDAPRVGAAMHAIVLMLHGTEQQKHDYLREIRDDSVIWGIGYSEPDAGSDLAAIRTRATRDGDGWVINGEKIWTTTYWGSYMFVAARTDPTVSRGRRGLSVFIVPTDAEGLTFRPTKTLYSGYFANVRYDGVRVPADALLGAENDGWNVLTSALATERGVVGAGMVVPMMALFDEFCRYLRTAERDGRPLATDSIIRDRVAGVAAEIEAARQLMLHCAELGSRRGGEVPIGDAAVSKVYTGELMERFTEVAVGLLGIRGAVTQGGPGDILGGRLEQTLRHSLMWVISLGTNEIQRNIIAQQALGLPR